MDQHPFASRWPLSAALGVVPVKAGTVEHAAVDEEEVMAKLGDARFSSLSKDLKEVLSCGHRTHAPGHTLPHIVDQDGKPVDLGGYEAHAIFLDDLEAFLAGGG